VLIESPLDPCPGLESFLGLRGDSVPPRRLVRESRAADASSGAVGESTCVSAKKLLMTDYWAIFDAVESTLIRVGSQKVPETTIRRHLDEYKRVGTKQFTDADYFELLIRVPFYSGFRGAIVNKKMGAIRRHFPTTRSLRAMTNKGFARSLPIRRSYGTRVRSKRVLITREPSNV